MATHDHYPGADELGSMPTPEWFRDGTTRTVIQYPPQLYAPLGSHNVFYNQPNDQIRLSREHKNIDPSTTAALFAVYRISCDLIDHRTSNVSRRY